MIAIGTGTRPAERVDRDAEAVLGQQRGMQAAGELPQLFERERGLIRGAAEQLACRARIVVELVEREPDRHRERDEVLLRAVVEVPLEAPSLDVTGGDDAGPRRGEVVEARLELGVQAVELGLVELALGDVLS